MLLRRFSQHVKKQNWFAAGPDFLVFASSVFINTLPRRTLSLSVALALASCATPQGAQPQAPACMDAESPAGADIRLARAAFNDAIRDKDLAAIAALLAEDVTLITGTDSTLFNGREAQLAIWREDFEADTRAIYDRTTECVSVSAVFPIAFETGSWRGVSTDDAATFAGGIYSAKWRKVDGAWQLEAEIFSTEICGGSFCPADAPP